MSPETVDGEKLRKLIDYWFYSDLDIEFELKRGKGCLLCLFESDVWYEHINNNQGVTIRSIRHNGDHRRFIVVDGDDDLFQEVKDHCHILHTKEKLLALVEELEDNFRIIWS